jgi:hypothetical protein
MYGQLARRQGFKLVSKADPFFENNPLPVFEQLLIDATVNESVGQASEAIFAFRETHAEGFGKVLDVSTIVSFDERGNVFDVPPLYSVTLE